MDRLPTETVVEIFRAGSVSPGRTEWARTVSNTCQHWRAIAYDTPYLWNEVHCVMGSADPLLSAKYLNTQLARTKNIPLDILVETEWTYTARRLPAILDLLIPYLPRCIHLQLRGCRLNVIQALLSAHSSLPLLHHLSTINGPGWEE